MDALKGVFSFSLSIYLWSVIFSFVYRFPVPFLGYIGPFGDKGGDLTFFASIYAPFLFSLGSFLAYTIVGGFLVIIPVGVLYGLYIEHKYSHIKSTNKLHMQWGLLLGFILTFTMANLDYIIGDF